MGATYKAVSFDIDTKVAREIFGKKYTRIYTVIEDFMTANDFRHKEGSQYISKKPRKNCRLLAKLDKRGIHNGTYKVARLRHRIMASS